MSSWQEELRDFGRGATGALVFGTPFLLTMETWWVAWMLPVWIILPSAMGAVLLVLALSYFAGFRKKEEREGPPDISSWLTEVPQILLQSLLAAYVVLALYGVIQWNQPWVVVARVGLIQVIALGLGAALANRLLRSDGDGAGARPFPAEVALFSMGALFFVLHLAPTEETVYLATLAGWWRMAAILLASLLVGHLVLFELEFRGQESRIHRRTRWLAWGESFMITALSVGVSALALAGFGQFLSQPFEVWIQKSIVLSLPAAVGGSAARVIIQ